MGAESRISVRVSEEVREAVKQEVERTGTTQAEVVRGILERVLLGADWEHERTQMGAGWETLRDQLTEKDEQIARLLDSIQWSRRS